MSNLNNGKTVKRTFWGAAAFYILIAFEFFYMASPFAAYFYAVYQPALSFFNKNPILSGMVSYFLPHFSETSSMLINLHNIIGAILAILGFLGFCIGACQVYYHKLTKKGAVTGGIYNYIRHPQYVSFIICSFGLLLLWPRYIVLMMFNTMLFAYYFLAKVEERECEAKFGESYLEYKSKTGMFFPFKLPLVKKFSLKQKNKLHQFLIVFCLYILILSLSVGGALWLHNRTLNNLYTVYTNDTAYIAVTKTETAKMNQIIEIALTDEEVIEKLNRNSHANRKYLNYILPSEWYVSEIPMNEIRTSCRHGGPADYDRYSYKIIFTEALFRSKVDARGRAIIENLSERTPLFEAWVNLAEQKVVKILSMPEKIKYDQIPVAVY